jgi:tetratricopeptide (TPR) repeat protein
LLTHIKVVKKRLVKLVSFAAALLSFALLPIAHAAISEGDALNYFQQGNDQYRLGNIAAAVADYTVAIQFEPGVALLYSARGGARHALGDYQSALTDFTIAIQLSPSMGFSLRRSSCGPDLVKELRCRERLSQVLATNARNYDEYVRAVIELKKLGNA